jgi:hypothetical protein
VILAVGCTIDFDDEPGFPAEEVRDMGTDRCAADELEILKYSAAADSSTVSLRSECRRDEASECDGYACAL